MPKWSSYYISEQIKDPKSEETGRGGRARDSEKKKRWTAEAAPSGYTRASDRCDSSNGRVPDSCCCNSSTGIKLDR